MKIIFTSRDKILIGLTVFMYVLGWIRGGWSIIVNTLLLLFVLNLLRASYKKGKISLFNLIMIMLIIFLNLLVKFSF